MLTTEIEPFVLIRPKLLRDSSDTTSHFRHAHTPRLLHGEFKALNMDVLGRMCDALQCQPGDLLVLVDKRSERKHKLKARAEE